MRSGRLLAVALAGILPGIQPAAAQTVVDEDARDVIRDDLRDSDITGLLAGLVNFEASPDIVSANFELEPDDELSTLKLPFGTDLEVPEWPVDLHVEAGVGYLTVDEVREVGPTRIDADWWGVSGFVGAGPAIALGEGTVLRPVADVVLSYLENDAGYRGPQADGLEALLTDILYDAHLATAGVALALELEHEEPVGEDGLITLAARYTHLFAWSFAASDDVLEGFGQSDTLSGYVELEGPTPFTLVERDIRWNGVLANTTLFGSGADALGFDYFFEIGGGLDLRLRPGDLFGLETVGFRVAGLAGDDVTGWTVGLRLDF